MKPSVEITEQPGRRSARFRYATEKNKSTPLRGTSDKNGPKIKIRGFKGHAEVRISCVMVDLINGYYKPHPHHLIGRNCKNGIFVQKLFIMKEGEEISFDHLGIQYIKSSDVNSSLMKRMEASVDPYGSKYYLS